VRAKYFSQNFGPPLKKFLRSPLLPALHSLPKDVKMITGITGVSHSSLQFLKIFKILKNIGTASPTGKWNPAESLKHLQETIRCAIASMLLILGRLVAIWEETNGFWWSFNQQFNWKGSDKPGRVVRRSTAKHLLPTKWKSNDLLRLKNTHWT